MQRIYAHRTIAPRLLGMIQERAAKLVRGDPFEPATKLAPLIAPSEAARLSSWCDEALGKGARALFGSPKHEGALFGPIVLSAVEQSTKLATQEAFGPVCVFNEYSELTDVHARINASPYGLQAGIFTNDLQAAFATYRALHVGGVVVNDVPSARVDVMPYGGIKDSGVGREGLRYSIAEFTEPRILLMKSLL